MHVVGAHALAGVDGGCFGFDQFHNMRDHIGVFDMVIGHARKIDHMLSITAAGDADVGLARFARAVDDAAEDRERQWRFNMAERVLKLSARCG